MNKGVKTIIYPAKDLESAVSRFNALLGINPYTESPYYVGYRIGDQEIGLDPNLHNYGMTAYYMVDDILKTKKSLVDNGAEVIQDVRDVGLGRRVASFRDPEGNIIGIMQEAQG